MAVVIRFARHGRVHRPYFWLVAIDRHEHREGKFCEKLGIYDPLLTEKNLQVDIEAVHRWINQGAITNPAVINLLTHAGYEVWPAGHWERKAKQKARIKARRAKAKKKDGKVFVGANRRALRRHQATVKAKAKELAQEQAKAQVPAAQPAAEAPAAPQA